MGIFGLLFSIWICVLLLVWCFIFRCVVLVNFSVLLIRFISIWCRVCGWVLIIVLVWLLSCICLLLFW